MKPRHQVSEAAIELIKRFEGYRRTAARLPDGRWTLGYGHTRTAREGAEVSEADAEALLLYDLIAVAHAVNELTLAPINRNQFDALCAFVFNIGIENFRTSTVLRRLNEGAVLQAAAAMELWRRADVNGERIVVDALVRRRAAEKLLFLTPTDGWVAASTPMLPPRLDHDAIDEFALQPQPPFEVATDDEPQAIAAEPAAPSTESERAAAAVGARLEQIFPEPEPAAGPVLRLTPAPQFDLDAPVEPAPAPEPEPRQEGPTLFDVAPAAPPKPTRVAEFNAAPVVRPRKAQSPWLGALAPVLLVFGGMALAAGALVWSVYARGAGGAVDPRLIGWIGGPAGLLVAAFGLYLALRRLGDLDEA